MNTASRTVESVNPLAVLERKVDMLIEHCNRLNAENKSLREAKDALTARIETGAARLEALLARLPEDE